MFQGEPWLAWWEDECNNSSDPSSPTLFSPPSDGIVRHTKQKFPVLRGTGSPYTILQGGAHVVGHPHDKMEWEIPSQEGSGSGNRFRCISDRMGCSVLEYTVGQHPLVTRLMRGVFNDRPPVFGYNSTWNVQAVLTHITSWGETESLSLKQVSWKTALYM